MEIRGEQKKHTRLFSIETHTLESWNSTGYCVLVTESYNSLEIIWESHFYLWHSVNQRVRTMCDFTFLRINRKYPFSSRFVTPHEVYKIIFKGNSSKRVFSFNNFLLKCVYLCVHVGVCAYKCKSCRGQKRNYRWLKAGNQMQVLYKTVFALNHWAIYPAPLLEKELWLNIMLPYYSQVI